LKLYEFENLT